MYQQIVFASDNNGKIAEIQQIFANLDIEIVSQAKYDVPEIDEPYHTFVENALHKARHATRYTKLPVLADDSGLCVAALNNQPGVYSARYAGVPKDDANNNKKLVAALSNVDNTHAYYYCVLVLLQHDNDPQPIIADGMLAGRIILTPRGMNGFGYDPHFYLPEYGKTTAELDTETKNQISHRRIAINKLYSRLRNYSAVTTRICK